jgi:hypothetical protein
MYAFEPAPAPAPASRRRTLVLERDETSLPPAGHVDEALLAGHMSGRDDRRAAVGRGVAGWPAVPDAER